MRRLITAAWIVGRRFGRWLVLEETDSKSPTNRRWLCRCDCGTIKPVFQYALLRGASKSCGCTQTREKPHYEERKVNDIPEWMIWAGIKKRCYNQKDHSYSRYGGRGIQVCARWINSYENFLADMGRRPSPQHSIERKDNNGDYEPGNCRWATAKEQGRNKRNNRLLRCGDVIGTLSEWTEICGFRPGTIHQRLKRGWTLLDTMLRPLDNRGKNWRGRNHGVESHELAAKVL